MMRWTSGSAPARRNASQPAVSRPHASGRAEHFGFTLTFEADWYVSLRHPSAEHIEPALVDHRHPTIPDGFRQPARGLLLNVEVSDVDAWHERLVAAGLRVALDLRNEAFGQRHFIVEAPDGVLVDVITPIDRRANTQVSMSVDNMVGIDRPYGNGRPVRHSRL